MKTKILVFAGVGIALIAFLGGRKSKKGNKDTADNTVSDSEREINKNKLSYPKSFYSQAASRLKEAFVGSGTAEYVVYGILKKLKTKSDWLKLISEFGYYSGSWYSVTKGNLITWIDAEMDEKEKKIVSGILKKINVFIFQS